MTGEPNLRVRPTAAESPSYGTTDRAGTTMFVAAFLLFAAGLGQFRLTAARSAHQLGDSPHQLACLDALDEAGRNSGDDGDLAFRLRGCNQHYCLAGLLFQVVNQCAQLAAIE